jgi:hypothetical protein
MLVIKLVVVVVLIVIKIKKNKNKKIIIIIIKHLLLYIDLTLISVVMYLLWLVFYIIF